MNDQSAKKLCFVIGPIGSEGSKERVHSEWVLEELIRPVMNGFPDFYVKRADEDPRPGNIDAQLINDLLTADLVIADMSGHNPNAFYEIGICHMVPKPTIHIQLADEKIPFDLSLYRSIKFSLSTPTEIRKARELLKAQVAATQAEGYKVDNPITKVRGIVKLQEQASPPEQVLLDQIADLNRRLANIEQPSIPTSIEGSSDALRDDDVLITFEFRPGTREGNKSTLISVLRVMTRRITWDKTGTTVQLIVPSHERHNVNRVLNEYRRFIKE